MRLRRRSRSRVRSSVSAGRRDRQRIFLRSAPTIKLARRSDRPRRRLADLHHSCARFDRVDRQHRVGARGQRRARAARGSEVGGSGLTGRGERQRQRIGVACAERCVGLQRVAVNQGEVERRAIDAESDRFRENAPQRCRKRRLFDRSARRRGVDPSQCSVKRDPFDEVSARHGGVLAFSLAAILCAATTRV